MKDYINNLNKEDTLLELQKSSLRLKYSIIREYWLKFYLQDKFWDDEKKRNGVNATWREFGEYLSQSEETKKYIFDNKGNSKLEELLLNIKYLYKTTGFPEKDLKFTLITNLYGDDGSLIYYHYCTECSTIIVVHNDTEECLNPLICPTCNEGKFINGYPWSFYPKDNIDYGNITNYINNQLDFHKKYNFAVGKPTSSFHLGKWYPRISIKNKLYSDGYKHYYFYLGFYPYRFFLEVKYFPIKIKLWFEKTFMKKAFEERLKRLGVEKV